MAVQWNDDLTTGNTTVDNQHKEFIDRINRLVNAMRDGKGKDEVFNTVDFLGDYIKLHFSSEEELMSKNAYPEIASHKGEHKKFIQEFEAFKTNLENEELGATRAHAIKAQNWLSGWLFSHIKKTDKQFIKTIKNK